MEPFFYLRPESLEQALTYLQRYGNRAKILAGGTDLIVKMKEGAFSPHCLIDIACISDRCHKGLDYIEPHNGAVNVGCMSTHKDLEKSRPIKEKFPALTDAAKQIGSVQIRNMATIGGNICNAAPSADTAPPLLVYESEVRIKGPSGDRVLPLEDFFLGPGETILKSDEILTEFILPPVPHHTGSAYLKHTRRQSMELPILGVALSLCIDKIEAPSLKTLLTKSAPPEEIFQSLEKERLTCKKVRIALGVAAPTPFRTKRAEALLEGQKLTAKKLDEAIKMVSREARPRNTWRSEAWYRREMIEVLIKRLIRKCLERILIGERM